MLTAGRLKQSSNFATGCDVINRWIMGTRNRCKALLESWPPPPPWPGSTCFLTAVVAGISAKHSHGCKKARARHWTCRRYRKHCYSTTQIYLKSYHCVEHVVLKNLQEPVQRPIYGLNANPYGVTVVWRTISAAAKFMVCIWNCSVKFSTSKLEFYSWILYFTLFL